VVLLSALLVPTIATADDLSWCVPGDAKTIGGSQDPVTNEVVAHVCDPAVLPACCNQQSGRWSLLCVQKAADSTGLDPCGRKWWAKYVVQNTQQHIPRDFSLVVLSGGTTGFMDVQGPIAANGDVTPGTGFSLNGYTKQPLALSSAGKVTLNSGTVFGNVSYGTTYNNVNNSARVSGSVSKGSLYSPINFPTVSLFVSTMSDALNHYPLNGTAGRPTNQTQTIAFTGADKELNVFSLSGDLIGSTTLFHFDVPSGSSAIINVTGNIASFKNAGFDATHGVPANSKIFWNMPNVTSLSITSMSLPGSILAPNAQATLTSGQVYGTVVVHDMKPSWIEFHWAPYHGLASSGCLAWDASWSCSGDTYLDDTENVVFPAPEAGFFQIDGESYSYTDPDMGAFNRTSPTHRIWYSFQPADVAPESKPLAVFFNGGPGGATSSGLFSFNTAPKSLDPDSIGSQEVGDNPSSWTQFANLLYIDAPATGFSYPMPSQVVGSPSVGLDIYRDAAVFDQVVVRFLDRHPALQCNNVVLVGESYGGTRASMMLYHVIHYLNPALSDPDTNASGKDYYGGYQDSELSSDLAKHFATCSAQRANQFGYQVLIEPMVAGYLQSVGNGDAQAGDSICVTGDDEYQCNQSDPVDPTISGTTDTWYFGRMRTAATNLTHIPTLRTALGVEPTTIAWLHGAARVGAYGHINDKFFSISTVNTDWNKTFGDLPSGPGAGDAYFVGMNTDIVASEMGPSYSDLRFGTFFLTNVDVGNVKTFMTHAEHDNAVDVLAIPRAFLDASATHFPPPKVNPYSAFVSSCSTAETWPNSSRPGLMRINYKDGAYREIRFPEYADAGHSVAQRMPGPLLADVRQWYGN
jgi:choice-of-anchor A domain-containing protein